MGYKINFATVKGLPSLDELDKMIVDYGMPEDSVFGVLGGVRSDSSLGTNIVRKTTKRVSTIDPATKEMTDKDVEKAELIAFRTTSEQLEVYTGGKVAIEQVGVFLSSCLGLATVVEMIELDLLAIVKHLESQKSFKIKRVSVSDFPADSYTIGAYGPAFSDPVVAQDFLTKYEGVAKSVIVTWRGPTGKVSVTLRPNGCISYSCKEDDKAAMVAVLRGLVQFQKAADAKE
jgi:hypothetical protein